MQKYEPVQQFVIVAPLLSGKREAYVRFVQELLGQRREAYEASRHDLGVTRERFWLLETAGASVAVVTLTAQEEAPVEALTALLNGRQPFGRWLQRHLRELHGLDLREEALLQEQGPLPELIAEWTSLASPDGRTEMPADSKERRES